MKAEEEFDDIFRKKSEEANFNFRQSDWEKVRRQIDEQRLAEYRSVSGLNYWIVSAVALLGSAALIYLAIPENTPAARADEVVYQPEPASAQISNGTSLKTEPAILAAIPDTRLNSKPTETQPEKISGVAPQSKTSATQTQDENPISPVSNSNDKIVETQGPDFSAEIASEQNETGTQADQNIIMMLLWPKTSRLATGSPDEIQLSNSTIRLPDEADYVENKTDDKQSFNAEFGLMYAGGLTGKSLQIGNGLNLFGGLNYNRMLSKQWSMGMGAQLYNLQGLDVVFYQNSSNDLGFGSTQTQTVLTCHSMLFVSFPVRLFFHPDQKHSFSLGLHAGSLLMAKNTVEVMQLSDGQVEQYSSEKQNAVYENMNSANFLISAGLHKSIQERVNLQVELYYGISDLFAESQESNVRQNTSGIRVGLSYRFTGK